MPVRLAPAVRAADLSDPAERARADAFVEAHAQGTPFHLTRWGTATAAGTRQRFHLLLAERGGSLTGLLPLTEVHSPLFGRSLVSTGFAVGGGVLGDDAAATAALGEAACALAARLSCGGIELRGGAAPGTGWQTTRDQALGFVRPLAADDDAELKAIPRKQRAEVRRALGFDLDVAIGRDPAMAAEHWRVYAQSVRNLGTPVFPASLFRAVLDAFAADADILTVRHHGRAVASVLSLYWRGTVYPFWGGGTGEARALRANDLMYFALMRHARERGCTRFDFGRSKARSGPAAFKKNWGFEGVPLVYHHRTLDGRPSQTPDPRDPKYRAKIAAWKRLPLPLANRLGPWIARGLG